MAKQCIFLALEKDPKNPKYYTTKQCKWGALPNKHYCAEHNHYNRKT